MAILELGAHMTVRPGQLEGFKKQAAECIRITKEKDTHTLRYDWFLSLDFPSFRGWSHPPWSRRGFWWQPARPSLCEP